MDRPTRQLTAAMTLLAILALVLSGCAAEDVADAAADTASDDAASDTAPDTGSAGSGAPEVEVSLVDYAFAGLPDTVPAGTTLSVTNDAEAELHELVAFRLPEDEDRAVTDLVELPADELLATLGEPAMVLLATPGGEQITAVGDPTLSEPGRYAVLCFIPTGVDPQAYLEASAGSEEGPPDIGDGPPHLVHGMVAELTVES